MQINIIYKYEKDFETMTEARKEYESILDAKKYNL